ncbi:vWA domain-containing protein [Liberiplasma polymorphum]|uniref:vWA domain-containing protein n=1 Tax=Liberiplasma polymorphum TaxID=3374570 RepID=UPI0037755329
MKKDCVEMVFILDRSGSMSGLENETIGGFNGMLKKQKALENEAYITTILFDNDYEVLHNRVPLKEVQNLTQKDYYVRGTTALLDAIGKTIEKIEAKHTYLPVSQRPEKTIFIITTDGMENQSRLYGVEEIKTMIEKQRLRHDWEFLFLGANIDAVKTAHMYGIDASRVADFHADKEGVNLCYEEIGNTLNELRLHKKINNSWNKNIKSDYASRK